MMMMFSGIFCGVAIAMLETSKHRYFLIACCVQRLCEIAFQGRDEDCIYSSGELYINPNDFVSKVSSFSIVTCGVLLLSFCALIYSVL